MYGTKTRTEQATRPILCFSDAIAQDACTLEVAGWKVHKASTRGQLMQHLQARDLRVGVFRLGPEPSRTLELIAQCRQTRPDLACIALVAPPELELDTVREGIALLCFDYLTTPINAELLRYAAGHAHGFSALTDRQAATVDDGCEELGILGDDPGIKALREQIRRVARADAAVLLSGESGTGKELAARAIHDQSPRRHQPFVALNMGALTEQLAQSELFGHEKGAFSGAVARHVGHIEVADGGTLFLDEIGDLSPAIQTSLLRFLQERVIQRVGGTTPIKVDVRIIAATHVDLRKAVIERRFREDLYFRLNVLNLTLPPLRDRGSDVLLLSEHFFKHFSRRTFSPVRGFSPAARQALMEHPWPGNVRELINRIQRAMIMAQGPLITPEDLELERRSHHRIQRTLAEVRRAAESEAISQTLQEVDFNLSAAARRLGISRVTLYRLMEEYGLERDPTAHSMA